MNKFVMYLAITELILTGLGVLGAVLLGSPPASVICINPCNDSIVYFCAYSFLFLCLAGLLCLVIKRLREPLAILVCVIVILYLALPCWNVIFEDISYKVARGTEAVERPCVIDDKNWSDFSITFRYLDGKTDEPITADVPHTFFKRLQEGDTCVAVVWDGTLGISFISKMKRIKRKNNNL